MPMNKVSLGWEYHIRRWNERTPSTCHYVPSQLQRILSQSHHHFTSSPQTKVTPSTCSHRGSPNLTHYLSERAKFSPPWRSLFPNTSRQPPWPVIALFRRPILLSSTQRVHYPLMVLTRQRRYPFLREVTNLVGPLVTGS